MIITKRTHATTIGAAVAGILILVTGCAGSGAGMTNDELFESAREVNLAFKETVAQVQLQIVDDEWQTTLYGDVPSRCDDGYSFEMTRVTPDGWRIGRSALDMGTELGEWMGTNGWSDVSVRTYDNGINNVLLTARNPDAFVMEISVDIAPGEAMDGVMISSESTCEAGSQEELMTSLFPGFPQNDPSKNRRPESELPGTTPVFGFTSDGTPR